MSLQTVDLSQLPAPDLIEPLNYETILALHKAALLQVAPEMADALALESDPAAKLLEVAAYNELLLRARINDAARASMLALATGADLDNLAALMGVARATITPADPATLPPTPAVMEGDASLRRRAQLAVEGLSAAGSREAYRFYALSAHADVLDAAVSSPTPGVVAVHVLSRSGDGTPGAPLLAAVLAALSADDVRPLTDTVTTHAAEPVDFAVTATLHLGAGPSVAAVRQAAEQALAAYATRAARIGEDVALSGIYAALHQSGVERVDLASPQTDIACAAYQFARCTGVSLQLLQGQGDA